MNKDARTGALGEGRERPGCLLRVRLRAQWRVHRPEQRRREAGLDAANLARREQLDPVALRPQGLHPAAFELQLRLRVDGLERAGLPELDVLSQLELDALEQLLAAGREVRLQIRLAAPSDGVDGARVDARGAGGDLTALEQRHLVTVLGEVIRGRRSGDAAAHHEDVGIDHRGSAPGMSAQNDPGSRMGRRALTIDRLRLRSARTAPGRWPPPCEAGP